MKLYLATPVTALSYVDPAELQGRYILETYHAIKNAKDLSWLQYCREDFLLDSGAYTYMRGNGGDLSKIDWDKYIHNYAAFIKTHGIKYFFELDIDAVIGYSNVKYLTQKLNKLAERQCIPVWHRKRGYEEWLRSIKDYSYVSLSASGNNGSSEWTRTRGAENVLYKMNKVAMENNCKVHALGYTKIDMLRKIPFYSVDSASWVRGAFGTLTKFNPNSPRGFDMIKKPAGKNMVVRETHAHNFREWLKIQEWAKNNL